MFEEMLSRNEGGGGERREGGRGGIQIKGRGPERGGEGLDGGLIGEGGAREEHPPDLGWSCIGKGVAEER